MRNHFKYIVAILLLLFVSVSCTSNFEDVSKNPNASDEALPQALLAPALTLSLIHIWNGVALASISIPRLRTIPPFTIILLYPVALSSVAVSIWSRVSP